MANLKTSEENYAESIYFGNLIRVANAGQGNYALPAEKMLIEAITWSDFLSSMSDFMLVPNKTYQVVDFVGIIDDTTTFTAYFTAQTTGKIYPTFYFLTNNNKLYEGAYNQVTGTIYYIKDTNGNEYLATTDYGMTSWCYDHAYLNKFSKFTEAGGANDIQGNPLFTNTEVEACSITTTNTNTSFYRSKLNLTNIYIQKAGVEVNFTNCNFQNVLIFVQNSSTTNQINITNCNWRNCIVYIKNGAQVNYLTIEGTYDPYYTTPEFTIDGAYQSLVANNYYGYVLADARNGYSTVKGYLSYNTNLAVGTWSSTAAYLPLGSPIGQWMLSENTGATNTTYNIANVVNAYNNKWSSIRFSPRTSAQNNQWNFTLVSSRSSISTNTQILSYHGSTPKQGQLVAPNTYVTLRWQFYDNTGNTNGCLHLVPDSPHYD